MENVARILVTVFFIGLIAIAIIFFGVFGLVPLEKVGKIGKNSGSGTSTASVNFDTENIEKQNKIGSATTFFSAQNSGTAGNGEKQETDQSKKTENSTEQINQTPPVEPESKPSVPAPYVAPKKKEIRLDVPPGSSDAPQQSSPLSPNEIPQDAIRIVVKDSAFNPQAFVVKKGKEITIALESGDNRTHTFVFKDPSFSAVAIGVGPHEIRTMTFAPPAVGEFYFFCSVPGHEASGEYGKMVVTE